MQSDLVSIIMPVYKTEKYIEKAIVSVMQQTYTNIELLCVNDGTPDRSFEICRQLSKTYDNLRLLDNGANYGLEYTRNHGLDEAKGRYVMFVDSDDTIDPVMVQTLVHLAKETEADVVMSTYSKVINDEELPWLADNMPETAMSIQEFTSHMLRDLDWSIVSCVGTKLYKTSIIQDIHLRFDKTYKYNEDGGFILSFLRNATRVAYKNQPFYKYYIRNSGSIMSSYRPDMFASIVRVNELMKQLFLNNNVMEKQQVYYYRKLFFVMLDSLTNEVKFANKKSYDAVVKTVCQYKDYRKMLQVLTTAGALPKRHLIILRLMKYRLYGLLFLLLKLKNR